MTIEGSVTDAKIQHAARLAPDWWIETVLGVKLWQLQKLIARSVAQNPRTSVRSCEGSGKSFVAACIALWFLYNFVPSTVITTAPTGRQVEGIIWREMRSRFHGARMELGGEVLTKTLNLSENHFAIGFTTDEPEKFQGFHNENVLVIGDEASGLSEICYQAMENPLSTGFTRELIIGNPTQSVGTFRESATSKLYNTFHISAFDTPNYTAFGITQQDIESGAWKEKMEGKELPYPTLTAPAHAADIFERCGVGSFFYQVFILGNFPGAGVNNLIPLSLIENAMAREPSGDLQADKIAALDVSRYGDDETVFGMRQADRIFPLEAWHHQDTMFTAGRTARLIKAHKPILTRIDVIGVGGGVVDRLQEMEGVKGVEAFNVSEAALDKEFYANRRAELYYKVLTMLMDESLSLPQDPVMKAQLADLRYTYKSNGQLKMESKEEARSRGSKSPDRGDVVMMLCAPLPVRKTGKPKSRSYL